MFKILTLNIKKMMIDIHCHLEMLEDIRSAVRNAEKAGVSVIVANGLDFPSNEAVLEMSYKYKIIKAALGLYPNLDFHVPDDLEADQIIEQISTNKKKIVALGEVGLDFKDSKSEAEKEQQIKNFRKIIETAKKLDLPMIVHSRKAEKETIEVLESSKNKKVVMHCFSGKKHLIKKAVDLGFYFSIPTNVVRSMHFQNLIETVPLSRLFCETDSPYLSPFRDKTNEPSFVAESYKMIAKIKGLTVDETIKAVYMNYKKLFE